METCDPCTSAVHARRDTRDHMTVRATATKPCGATLLITVHRRPSPLYSGKDDKILFCEHSPQMIVLGLCRPGMQLCITCPTEAEIRLLDSVQFCK